jgi:hypothetical protein
VALPKDHELSEPSFSHLPKAALPEIVRPGTSIRLLAGTAFGARAPTPTFSPMVYAAVAMQPGAALDWPPEHEQRGVYAVEGELSVAGEPLPEQHLAVLQEGASIAIEAAAGARCMLLGGDAMDGDRLIWWNFVASSPALIDEASARWREKRFPPVPGETEFIPLPER